MWEPKLISVTAAEPWRLRLTYETGEVKLFDVAPFVVRRTARPDVFPHGTSYRRRRGDCVGERSGPRAP